VLIRFIRLKLLKSGVAAKPLENLVSGPRASHTNTKQAQLIPTACEISARIDTIVSWQKVAREPKSTE